MCEISVTVKSDGKVSGGLQTGDETCSQLKGQEHP